MVAPSGVNRPRIGVVAERVGTGVVVGGLGMLAVVTPDALRRPRPPHPGVLRTPPGAVQNRIPSLGILPATPPPDPTPTPKTPIRRLEAHGPRRHTPDVVAAVQVGAAREAIREAEAIADDRQVGHPEPAADVDLVVELEVHVGLRPLANGPQIQAHRRHPNTPDEPRDVHALRNAD